jgi:hypothetical protein
MSFICGKIGEFLEVALTLQTMRQNIAKMPRLPEDLLEE